MYKITYHNVHLRKCKYYRNENETICYFHGWTTEPFQEEEYQSDGCPKYVWVQYPRAIIEFEDGTIVLVFPESIKFITGEEDVRTTDEGTV